MRGAFGLSVIAMAVGASSSCLDPTQVTLVLDTDVPCDQVKDTAVALGAPGDDSTPASASTVSCNASGGIGTLVIYPQNGANQPVGIRVTLGVTASASDCVAPDFDGCIVARRSIRYISHQPLTLPITLQQSCLGVVCAPGTTCVDAQCVDVGSQGCDPGGVCGLDAGRADDAGALGDCLVGPVLVAPGAPESTPHIVKTSAGYAISWVTATGEVHVLGLSSSGATTSSELTIVSGTGLVGPIGPLGTDGTNFALPYTGSGGRLFVGQIDPSGKTLAGLGTTNLVSPPIETMHYDAAAARYYFLASDGSHPVIGTFNPAGGGGASAPILPAPGMTDLALDYSSGSYFAEMHDASSCLFSRFSPTLVAFGPVEATPSCSTVRVVSNATGELQARAVGGSLKVTLPSVPAIFTLGSVDSQAIVTLLSPPSSFHVVWRWGGLLRETTIHTNTTVPPLRTLDGATNYGGSGAGFDAVADPGSQSYAVVYWANLKGKPGMYFMHRCY